MTKTTHNLRQALQTLRDIRDFDGYSEDKNINSAIANILLHIGTRKDLTSVEKWRIIH